MGLKDCFSTQCPSFHPPPISPPFSLRLPPISPLSPLLPSPPSLPQSQSTHFLHTFSGITDGMQAVVCPLCITSPLWRKRSLIELLLNVSSTSSLFPGSLSLSSLRVFRLVIGANLRESVKPSVTLLAEKNNPK